MEMILTPGLGGVFTIFMNDYAFSALKQDGSVWHGGTPAMETTDNSISLQLLRSIVSSTDMAFAIKG